MTGFLSDLQWTDKKVFLDELIYSIHSAKSVNHGKISLKKLANGFEKLFNISLGNFYDKFSDLSDRKANKTSYLDALTRTLNDRIENPDNYK